jgi:hypothetical protein
MIPSRTIEGRIRVAALLLLAGVAVEAVTLSILHPLAFVAFASAGVLLIVAGLAVFLLTLLVATDPERT